MKTYSLKSWKIEIENMSQYDYEYVCDEKNLMIMDRFQDCVAFLEINQKENLVLQKMPYYFQYRINSEQKCLTVSILD